MLSSIACPDPGQRFVGEFTSCGRVSTARQVLGRARPPGSCSARCTCCGCTSAPCLQARQPGQRRARRPRPARILTLLPLIVLSFWIGLYPKPMFDSCRSRSSASSAKSTDVRVPEAVRAMAPHAYAARIGGSVSPARRVDPVSPRPEPPSGLASARRRGQVRRLGVELIIPVLLGIWVGDGSTADSGGPLGNLGGAVLGISRGFTRFFRTVLRAPGSKADDERLRRYGTLRPRSGWSHRDAAWLVSWPRRDRSRRGAASASLLGWFLVFGWFACMVRGTGVLRALAFGISRAPRPRGGRSRAPARRDLGMGFFDRIA